jgi:hypothetical protein
MDDSTRVAVADSTGTFFLEVSARSQQLEVRAIGYAPGRIGIEPRGESPIVADHVLATVNPGDAQALAAVRINADRTTARRSEFDERRRYETGHFLDDETLARAPFRTTSIMQFPRVFTRNGGVTLARGIGACAPRWFIDGVDQGRLLPPEPDYWVRLAKRIEIYRAAFAPPRFTDFDGCGAIVIWTQ